MAVPNILSVCLFVLFVVMVLVRAAAMRRRGIRAVVFGQTDKSDFILAPLVLAVAYAALANTLGLPMLGVLIRPLWDNNIPGWIGLFLCVAADAGFALTLAVFGDSFRVGIDENKPDKLITNGLFKISRNPVYMCFLIFFAGLFLIHRNIVIAVAVVLFSLAIHRQILREEKFLASHYGAEYEEYRRKVRRYL